MAKTPFSQYRRGPGSTPGQGTGSHMPQLKGPLAAAETWHSQMKEIKINLKQKESRVRVVRVTWRTSWGWCSRGRVVLQSWVSTGLFCCLPLSLLCFPPYCRVTALTFPSLPHAFYSLTDSLSVCPLAAGVQDLKAKIIIYISVDIVNE